MSFCEYSRNSFCCSGVNWSFAWAVSKLFLLMWLRSCRCSMHRWRGEHLSDWSYALHIPSGLKVPQLQGAALPPDFMPGNSALRTGVWLCNGLNLSRWTGVLISGYQSGFVPGPFGSLMDLPELVDTAAKRDLVPL